MTYHGMTGDIFILGEPDELWRLVGISKLMDTHGDERVGIADRKVMR